MMKNGDKPYLKIIDAMSYWPELETAVAIRKLDNGEYECISSFGFMSLLLAEGCAFSETRHVVFISVPNS